VREERLTMDIVFFKTPAELRRWLEENHDKTGELWVGFYKKDSGQRGITYAEAVDEALAFGWIDGIRKGVDEKSYTNRFTPRKRHSTWSQVNIKRVGELSEMGRMHPAGLKAFNERDLTKTNLYSFEQDSHALEEKYEQEFRANRKAWESFQAMPPSYRKPAIWWVMSAKKEETRQKRMAALIEVSEKGQRLPQLSRPGRGQGSEAGEQGSVL
jgi:uncharacterized protein YdeI (YjbR/CyaY-like superfamily)